MGSEFISVADVGEAIDVLAARGADARVMAGGTDVMLQRMRGQVAEPVILHIEGIEALRTLDTTNGLSIGALVTHRNVVVATLPAGFDSLQEAADTVGGWQTQNVGTVVGNVCNASPAADLVAPLLTFDATITLRSGRGTRELALADFLLGRRSIDRHPAELATGIRIEPTSSATGSAYEKVGRRRAMEVAIAGLAVRVSLDDVGETSDVAVATCSVGPTPCRHPDVEAVLRDSRNGDGVAEAAHLLVSAVQPIDDARATARYRRQVIGRILPRTLARATRRARDSHTRSSGR
jgi:aerobic carbon-monoxide dehydrogenase medium subunit